MVSEIAHWHGLCPQQLFTWKRASVAPGTVGNSVREAMMMERSESSHDIEKELLDQLLAGCDPNEVFANDGLLDDLKKRCRNAF